MSEANQKQYGGNHYKCASIEPWDFIVANDIGFLDGTAIKYLARWRRKNGVEDLRKAIHFIEKLIEVETSRSSEVASESQVDKSADRPAIEVFSGRVTETVLS